MSEIPFICRPDDVTPEWLTTVLRSAGALTEGSVHDVSGTAVGTGQVGDSVRFTVSYSGGEGPATVVGKFPAEDETSRASSVATRTYEIESRFYQQLQHRVGITTPQPLVSLLDVEANEFVLIMNDLAPAEQGDQMVGCSFDQSALAMAEIAKLHAPVWGDASLVSMPWLNRQTPEGLAFYLQLFGMFVPGFLERYGDRVDAPVVDLVAKLGTKLEAYLSYRPEPRTAVHGDFRADNILFATEAGGAPMTTVDWQTVALGAGVSDVSYFLGTSLLSAERSERERELVREYHDRLRTSGVQDFSFERCWDDYRYFAFAGLLMAIGASMLVGQTDRGDEMFMAMANRSGTMALELESFDLIG